ncbi:MAG: FAD-dependent oxidoreductase [Pseudomonadota bacterium]
MRFDLQAAEAVMSGRGPYDVVIVGAGAAGITLARQLAAAGKRVALMEGGGYDYSDASQAVYRGEVLGDPYFPLESARQRFLGGTTNHWVGWSRGFEPVDFDRGALGPEYSWPIAFADLDPYLAPACRILSVPNAFEDRPVPQSSIRRIDFQFSPPVRFRDAFVAELDASEQIDLVLNANLVGLAGEGGRVRTASFENYDGKRAEVSGDTFIFAMGGIENSRFLLWFEQQYGGAFFSTGLPIGQYWMEHPHFTLGQAIVDKQKVTERFYAVNPDKQKTLSILNCGFRVDYFDDVGTKALIRDALCTVAPTLGKKLMGMAGKNLVCGARFRAAWEQAPTASNRVALGSDVDRFGVPRTALHWQKTALDRKTVTASVMAFSDWLLEADAGRIQLADWMLREGDYPEHDELAGYHHMGGTRMHASPAYGVVDADCKVFGSDNLYVAGSSLFTTGGHNNPTLPLVQFALRLADHLAA